MHQAMVGQVRQAWADPGKTPLDGLLAAGVLVEGADFSALRVGEQGEIAGARDVAPLKFRGGAHIQQRPFAIQKVHDRDGCHQHWRSPV